MLAQGYDQLHIAIDDHSRLAFVLVHQNERGTCAAFMADAIAWFTSQGVTVEAVMTDNAKNCTISRTFQGMLTGHDLDHITTKPFRPQTNGKAERFNRTLVDELAYAPTFTSKTKPDSTRCPVGSATTTPDDDWTRRPPPPKPSTTSVRRTPSPA